MNKKSVFTLLLVVILGLSLSVPSVWAGSKQRYRWQGVAIGLGAAILGGALLHHHSHARSAHGPAYCSPPPPPPRVVYRKSGHWQTRRVWVPPKKERIWHPGYYDRRGYWHPGYWEKRCRPGLWKKKQVWIPRDSW